MLVMGSFRKEFCGLYINLLLTYRWMISSLNTLMAQLFRNRRF